MLEKNAYKIKYNNYTILIHDQQRDTKKEYLNNQLHSYIPIFHDHK